MNTKATTPEELFAAAGERADDLRRVDILIQETAPEMERYMLGGGLGYGAYHYTYASGQEGDWPTIGLALQKNHLSLYICAVKDDRYLAELYSQDLGKVSTGKSCIRFKKADDLNLEQVKKIIREAVAWWQSQPKPAV